MVTLIFDNKDHYLKVPYECENISLEWRVSSRQGSFCGKIDLNSSMAIGDSYNDISMFEKVNFSVAMGNSIDSVKKHAKIKTETNNNNGVYKILKDVLNNKI